MAVNTVMNPEAQKHRRPKGSVKHPASGSWTSFCVDYDLRTADRTSGRTFVFGENPQRGRREWGVSPARAERGNDLLIDLIHEARIQRKLPVVGVFFDDLFAGRAHKERSDFEGHLQT